MLENENLKVVIDIANCAIQIMLAIVAWIALIYTKRQIPSTNKVKFKVKYGFSKEMNEEKEIKTVINVDIVNLGMAPVYVEGLGILLYKPLRKDKIHIPLDNINSKFETFRLEPGKPYRSSYDYNHLQMLNKITRKNHNRVRVSVYLRYHLDEEYHPKSISFNDFVFLYDKASIATNNVNRQFEKMVKEVEQQ